MVRLWTTACVAALIAGIATPALAQTCYDTSNSGPIIRFEIHLGEPYTEEEETTFVLMQLRRMGVAATRVEKWGGCYRAFVNDADGHGQHMEFFNAETLQPVGANGDAYMKLDIR